MQPATKAPEYTHWVVSGGCRRAVNGCRNKADTTPPERPPPMPTLTITADSAFAIVEKARQYAAKVAGTDPDSGSNPTDDASVDALEFSAGDDTRNELIGAIDDLNDDEQADLIALILVGRGDLTRDEWRQARATADDIGRAKIPEFVAQIPLASDYLEEGLSQFGETMADYFDRH